MGCYEFVITAPSAGDNLMDGEEDVESAPYSRMLEAIAFTGMTAIGDSVVEVFIGSKKVAIKRNSSQTQTSPSRDDYTPLNNKGGIVIPKNVKLIVKLHTDGGGNAGLGLIIA